MPIGVKRSRKELFKIASEIKTRKELYEEHKAVYRALKKEGIYAQATTHMSNEPRRSWTKELCGKEALKFKGRTEFARASVAYQAARRMGWLDDICVHMTSRSTASVNDMIYVWEAKEFPGIHKIGITSSDLGVERIFQCAGKNAVTPNVKILVMVENARALERKLLSIGKSQNIILGDGYSEMRFLNETEIQECLDEVIQWLKN